MPASLNFNHIYPSSWVYIDLVYTIYICVHIYDCAYSCILTCVYWKSCRVGRALPYNLVEGTLPRTGSCPAEKLFVISGSVLDQESYSLSLDSTPIISKDSTKRPIITFSSKPTTTKCSSMLAFAFATAPWSPEVFFVYGKSSFKNRKLILQENQPNCL